MPIVHIVGAGVAGLACAVRSLKSGGGVALYEAAPHAGGRCRSFFDDILGCPIDNGNHLLLSGNGAVMTYLDEIGATGSLAGPSRAAFSFVELGSGRRWTVRPNAGLVPWWIFRPSRRVPESGAADYLGALALLRAGPEATVAECFDTTRPLYRRFWKPFAVAVLNAAAEEGAARLLWPVVAEIFGRGEAAWRPRVAAQGLSRSFVDPALATVRAGGGRVHFSHRLRALETSGRQAVGLDFGTERVAVAPEDKVVLAVPPASAAELLPLITAPTESRAIVNAHFRLGRGARWPEGRPLLGIIGGTAQWLFGRGDIVSVTVSAAEKLVNMPADQIARRLWADVSRALEVDGAKPPPCRIVKERRATFAQVPAQLPRRAGTRTGLANLFLAGDWTDTGLPATVEGAIRSGHAAAEAASSDGPGT